ncbi:Sensor histidine kinase TodS [termite gut metagenome]|uniref:Sensor histidine kinase TodS n=1 Tax=termite gut metagenome TaxID=433724 RepID=A0A5J4SQL6_9ZZZZ
MKSYFRFLFLTFNCVLTLQASAYNLKQISSRDGLSNSSVYCMLQDNQRFLWIGTYDGLNMYDGRNIHIYKPDINNPNSLSSNVIRNIVETDNNYLWIGTKWGLNKLSKRDNIIEEFHNEFKDDSYAVKDNNDNLFILGKKGVLSLYNKSTNKFIDLPINTETTCEHVSNVVIDSKNTIWINYKGTLERYTVSFQDPKKPQITRQSDYAHPYLVDYIFSSKKKLLMIDIKGNLYTITPQKTIFIKNISKLIHEYGAISSAIYDDTDILIGFKTNGVIHLISESNYKVEKIDINCGVFTLQKDEEQNIVWIGTDGQGVYAWTKDDYTFKNLNLIQLPILKQRPVRAIHTDHQNNLWLGTKDNGVIKIKNYNTETNYSADNVMHYTTDNGLNNNEVFALATNRKHNILWIGSNGPGLNYYSFQTKKVYSLINYTSNPIRDIHVLLDTQDSLLWIGTGNTLLKVYVQKQDNKLVTRYTKQFTFDVKNKQPFNQIYSLYQENDSIIWVGIRGNGIIRFNTENENYRIISFDEQRIAPMNDILCIHQDKNKTFWLGSSYGITRFNMHPNGSYEYKNFNENDGLPNNTIHGILEDPNGKLWLSSNSGIVLFDPIKNTFRNFNQKTGLKIVEFSDNAYYRDESELIYFFGGVDGLIWIKDKQNEKQKKFIPDIFFTKLRIFNKDYNINDFEKRKGNERYIELYYKQNFFAISFVATDFINGENSQYSYKLDNFSNVWMDTRSNEAQFTNIPPGSYTLSVKYNDGMGDSESQIKNIRIVILPPWYLTACAKIIYVLLFLVFVCLIYYYIRKKYEWKKEKIDKQLQEKYKEEMYEGKLRFFTNITHELSTPLTLIYTPCERILSHENSDSFIKKYAQIIKSNTERLNTLIQEIIDFRRIETGNKISHIQQINISELTQEITESFNDLAEQNSIQFETNITANIKWNSDSSCYAKIMNNLISNAFKYTPEKGKIIVSVNIENQNLILKVYNTGKGIQKESIPFIFNRYSVLDNIKENSIKGLSSRNGLGLAICHSMTELLQGSIEVKSEINQYAEFIVRLPHLEADEQKTEKQNVTTELTINEIDETVTEKATASTTISSVQTEKTTNRTKNYILVIDDNTELLWMLKDILSDEYKVMTAEDGKIGLEILKKEMPDLIITDIMMPNTDGITLTKQIKGNKHTMHIPLVILSAKNANEEKIEGLDSGADVYISKPFNTDYLKTVIRNLIKNKKNMEEYYHSSASAFEFANGRLLQKEDKDFLQKVMQLIDNNMDNPEFSTEELADKMQMSVRNIYRKFKDLKQLPPNDFIKEQRIRFAAKLAITTTLTIQEIMYKSGFNNHSHFYKEFSKQYKQTPKEYRETYRLKDNSLK